MRQVWTVGIYHPAAILRGMWGVEPYQPIFLARAKEIADGTEPSHIDPDEAPPGALLDPTEEEMWDWYHHLSSGSSVSVDIECAGHHITVVGMCCLCCFVPIVFRFRARGGSPVMAQLDAKIDICDQVLSRPDIHLIFQNGQAFDIPILEETGFVVEGYFEGGFDTLLAGHACYPDSPKNLEFLALVWAGLGGWKAMVKAEGGEGK